MRLAWFFIISLTLHAAALVYFSAIHEAKPAHPIAVTILPIEPEVSHVGGGGRDQGRDAGKSKPTASDMTPRTTRFEPQLAIADALSESSLIPSPIELSAKYREAIVAHAAPTRPGEIISSAGGSGSTGAGAGGSGLGSAGSGSGIGSGRGSSPSGAITTQARYSDTPKPVYPENARREGREGRVLLRVMIDEQGKTKTAAVNRSSGSDALDQAALDAIKRWRFHPARADDKPVESWVNIPIDFRLTDAKN